MNGSRVFWSICLNSHFVLVQPEVVVCSHIWAGDALSSSKHFSESFQ